jgi:hypothetical protein
MNLSKKQLLLIHDVLFSHLASLNANHSSKESESIEDLMDEISQAILEGDEEFDAQKSKTRFPFRAAGMSVFGVDEEEEYEDEFNDSDTISIDDLMDLEDVPVYDCDAESKGRFNFFWSAKDRACGVVKYKDRDVDLPDSEILRIKWITRRGKSFTLGVSGTDFNFEVSKFPKDWTALLKVNTTYRID